MSGMILAVALVALRRGLAYDETRYATGDVLSRAGFGSGDVEQRRAHHARLVETGEPGTWLLGFAYGTGRACASKFMAPAGTGVTVAGGVFATYRGSAEASRRASAECPEILTLTPLTAEDKLTIVGGEERSSPRGRDPEEGAHTSHQGQMIEESTKTARGWRETPKVEQIRVEIGDLERLESELLGLSESATMMASASERLGVIRWRSSVSEASVVETATALAASSATTRVIAEPLPVTLNYEAQWIVQSFDFETEARPLYDKYGLFGENIVVGVGDSGLDYRSCFFVDESEPIIEFSLDTLSNVATYESETHRKIRQYVGFPAPQAPSIGEYEREGHGTHVAGSCLGDSLQESDVILRGTGEEYNVDGLAPKAKVALADLGEPNSVSIYPPADYNDLFGPAYRVGARIHTNSWGASTFGAYNQDSELVDQYAFEHQDFLVVFAAGNDGFWGYETIGAPATAKNALSVGATENIHTEAFINHFNLTRVTVREEDIDLASFSSRGPTRDGRIKPDVVAPGDEVYSASSTASGRDSCGATLLAGTSMATPIVSGVAALIQQYFQDGLYPTGERDPDHAMSISGPALKAVLIASAQQVGSGAGSLALGNGDFPTTPNVLQGFGMVVADEVLGKTFYVDGDAEDMPLLASSGDSKSYSFVIPTDYQATEEDPLLDAEGDPLVVALCWYDYPSQPLRGRAPLLINDLDLVVRRVSDGALFWPNGGDGRDDLNTVERVVVPASEIFAGDAFVANVSARAIEEVGDYDGQPFGLVAVGPFAKTPALYDVGPYTGQPTAEPTATAAPTVSYAPTTSPTTAAPTTECERSVELEALAAAMGKESLSALEVGDDWQSGSTELNEDVLSRPTRDDAWTLFVDGDGLGDSVLDVVIETVTASASSYTVFPLLYRRDASCVPASVRCYDREPCESVASSSACTALGEWCERVSNRFSYKHCVATDPCDAYDRETCNANADRCAYGPPSGVDECEEYSLVQVASYTPFDSSSAALRLDTLEPGCYVVVVQGTGCNRRFVQNCETGIEYDIRVRLDTPPPSAAPSALPISAPTPMTPSPTSSLSPSVSLAPTQRCPATAPSLDALGAEAGTEVKELLFDEPAVGSTDGTASVLGIRNYVDDYWTFAFEEDQIGLELECETEEELHFVLFLRDEACEIRDSACDFRLTELDDAWGTANLCSVAWTPPTSGCYVLLVETLFPVETYSITLSTPVSRPPTTGVPSLAPSASRLPTNRPSAVPVSAPTALPSLVPTAGLVAPSHFPTSATPGPTSDTTAFGFVAAYAPPLWHRRADADAGIEFFGRQRLRIDGVDQATQSAESLAQARVVVAANGVVSFSWRYESFDESARYDHFWLVRQDEATRLSDPDGDSTQSGQTAFVAQRGEVIGFRVSSDEGCCGRASVDVLDFRGPLRDGDPVDTYSPTAAPSAEALKGCPVLEVSTTCPPGFETLPTCDDPTLAVDDYCEGDGECGTDTTLANCGTYDVYLVVATPGRTTHAPTSTLAPSTDTDAPTAAPTLDLPPPTDAPTLSPAPTGTSDVSGFRLAYDPERWTTTGEAIFSDFEILELAGVDEADFGSESTVEASVLAAADGYVTFDWAYATADARPAFDAFSVFRSRRRRNIRRIDLSDDDGNLTQADSFSLYVDQGDTFGFSVVSRDSCCGAATALVSNFKAPFRAAPSPAPSTFLPTVPAPSLTFAPTGCDASAGVDRLASLSGAPVETFRPSQTVSGSTAFAESFLGDQSPDNYWNFYLDDVFANVTFDACARDPIFPVKLRLYVPVSGRCLQSDDGCEFGLELATSKPDDSGPCTPWNVSLTAGCHLLLVEGIYGTVPDRGDYTLTAWSAPYYP